MSKDIKCSFCGASLLNDDAEVRGILQAENDVLRKQLEVAKKEIYGAIYTFGQICHSPQRDTMIYHILHDALAEIERIEKEAGGAKP